MGLLKIPTIASTDRSTSTWAAAEVLYDTGQSRIYYGNAAAGGGVLLATGDPGAVAVTAPGASMSAGTLQFSNSPTVTFGMVGSTITASAAGGGGGAVTFSAGTSSAALSSLVFSNSNAVNFGLNGSTITASAAFSNANGISFGLSGGSVVTASHNALTTAALSGHSHGNPTLALTNLSGTVSSASSGLTLSLSALDNLIALSAGTRNKDVSRIDFNDANGISFGHDWAGGAGTITASHNGLTTAAASDHSHGNPTLSLVNLSGATASNSAGFTLSLSAAAPGAGAVNFSGGTTSNNLATIVFSNSNGVSFGLNGSTMTASVATSLTAIRVSAGTTSNNLSAITFGSSPTFSFGLNGSVVTGNPQMIVDLNGVQKTVPAIYFVDGVVSLTWDADTIVADVPPSISAINVSAGTTSRLLSAITFSDSNGVSFGFGTGSVLTASVAAAGGGATLSYSAPWANRLSVAGQVGQGTLAMQPWPLDGALQFDRVAFPIYNSNSSNSSGSHTLSFWGGIYTKNASTLSMVSSWSGSTAITHSGTAGSYSLFSGGPRLFTIGHTMTLAPSNYWLGFISRTTSGGANGTYSQFLVSAMASNFLGHFGSSHNTTYQPVLGQGLYTATTSAMPASVAFSQLRGSDSLAMRVTPFVFASGTV